MFCTRTVLFGAFDYKRKLPSHFERLSFLSSSYATISEIYAFSRAHLLGLARGILQRKTNVD